MKTKTGKSWMVKMLEREKAIKETRDIELALEHIKDLCGTLLIRNNTIRELQDVIENNKKEL